MAVFPGPPHTLFSLHCLQDCGVNGGSAWGAHSSREKRAQRGRRGGQILLPRGGGRHCPHPQDNSWSAQQPTQARAPASAHLPPAGQRTPASRSQPLSVIETIPDPENPVEGSCHPHPQAAGVWRHLRKAFCSSWKTVRPCISLSKRVFWF